MYNNIKQIENKQQPLPLKCLYVNKYFQLLRIPVYTLLTTHIPLQLVPKSVQYFATTSTFMKLTLTQTSEMRSGGQVFGGKKKKKSRFIKFTNGPVLFSFKHTISNKVKIYALLVSTGLKDNDKDKR